MSILVDALAAWGALSIACGLLLIGWCVLRVAADRREGRRALDEALRRMTEDDRA